MDDNNTMEETEENGENIATEETSNNNQHVLLHLPSLSHQIKESLCCIHCAKNSLGKFCERLILDCR